MKFFKIIIVIWLVLWVNFIARDLFKKGYLGYYRVLLGMDAEGRRSHVYGERFYEFLKFAKDNVPRDATYGLAGVVELSLAHRRAVYYLYPLIEKDNPEYILVYDGEKEGFGGYRPLAALDEKRFILKKR